MNSKNLSLTFLSIFIASTTFSQIVHIEGNVFLQGETSHDSIMVTFQRIAPSVLYDTAWTSSSGYYNKVVEEGIYDISYKKPEYLRKQFYDIVSYSDVTMPDTLMEKAICGSLKDTLRRGTYIVECNIQVDEGDTLIIEPGTELLFSKDTEFRIFGLLLAQGMPGEPVVFDWYIEGDYWRGLNYRDQSSDDNLLSYCLIEHSNNHAVDLHKATLHIDNSSLRNNHLVYYNNGVGGGAIRCEFADLFISKSDCEGNTSYDRAGAIMHWAGNLFIDDCTFSENYAHNRGGGLWLQYISKSRVTNSLFIANESRNTGGAICGGGYLEVINSNFVGNQNGYGGAIYGGVKIYNSIFSQNQGAIDNAGTTLFNNIFETGQSVSNSPDWFGKLVTINVNGDSTDAYGNLFREVNFEIPEGPSYHLSDSSPCINAGIVDTAGLDIPATDFEGDPRFWGNFVDIGYDEYTGCTLRAFTELSQISCDGENDGSAMAVINGGTAPFTFLWSPGDETDTAIYNLNPDNYSLLITDGAGCTSLSEFKIHEPDSLGLEMQIFASSCGEASGSALAVMSGGTQPYQYDWDGMPGGFALTGIYAGMYNLHVTDKNGCSLDYDFTVPGPDSLMADFNKNDLTCYNSNDGSIVLKPYGGTEPYYFQWDQGYNTDSITDLGPGIYSYTITDSENCVLAGSIIIHEPEEFKLAVSIDHAPCGTANGSATVVPYQGGAPPYAFLWSNGDNTTTADSLSAGTYSVKVYDQNGCLATSEAEVADKDAPEIFIDSLANVSCFELSDGAIRIGVENGSPPLSYEWLSGDTTEIRTELAAGVYEVIVKDTNECTDNMAIEITEPERIVVFISSENTTCGMAEGIISLNVSGGLPPYSYSWSNGGNQSIEDRLNSGLYSVTIRDKNDCILEKEAWIADVNGPVLSVDSISPAGCDNNDGYIQLVIENGMIPCTFTWSDGRITNMPILNNLYSDSYSVVVEDSVGCKDELDFLIPIKNPDKPEICVVSVDSTSGYNQILWNKLSFPGIDHYRIYKERYLAGLFEYVGEVSQNGPASFTDEYANPRQRSWKYRITAVDGCGNESEMSEYHETIHLTINVGLKWDVNLIWNSYDGFQDSTYYIHRKLWNSDWEIIDSIPTSRHENKYTDFEPSHNWKIDYFISHKIPGGTCNPVSSLKGVPIPYAHSISNVENYSLVLESESIKVPDELTVFPNPVTERATIQYITDWSGPWNIKLMDLTGKILKVEKMFSSPYILERERLPAGIYILEIKGRETHRQKLLFK